MLDMIAHTVDELPRERTPRAGTPPDGNMSEKGFYDPASFSPHDLSSSLTAQVLATAEAHTHLGGSSSMPSDAHKPNMSDRPAQSSSFPDSSSRPSSTGRRARRPLAHQQSPTVFYPPSSTPGAQESANVPSPTLSAGASLYPGRPPLQHYSPSSSQYGQQGSFVGQYTMSSQQPPLTIGQNTPYSYPHPPYHHAGVPTTMEPNLLPQNAHVGYRPMLQQHPSVYQYQRHSPESGVGTHSTFPTGTSQMYSHPHVNPSSPPRSPLTLQQSSPGAIASPHPSSYGAQTNQYQPLRYPSPSASYSYPAQSFAPAPYQGQYAPSPYPQAFAPSPDQEVQGMWYYMPHGAPTPPFNESMQMQYQPPPHFPVNYQRETPYTQANPVTPPNVSISSSAQQSGRRSHLLPLIQSNVSQNTSPASSASQGPGSPVMSSRTGRNTPSNTGTRPQVERQAIRRSYHPNPPAHRSEWVMWVGNVPNDATHDELWRFLKQPPSGPSTSAEGSSRQTEQLYDGISSIFLISRSNCAFVNFDSEPHLQSAISRFNGMQLRPNDPRCPRLVCRARRKDDDLKAGVGGQRGMGMHTRWVKDHLVQEMEQEDITPSSASEGGGGSSSREDDYLAPLVASMSLDSEEELIRSQLSSRTSGARRQMEDAKAHSGSSGSYTSTTSSILSKYFPKRYFIMKSLTQFDLDLSVSRGVWATQRHNEGILDQAFRTSKDVFLIFGVNKSGEFYGMAGPLIQGEHREQRISWASRPESSPSSLSSISPSQGLRHSESIPEEPDDPAQSANEGKGKAKERGSSTFFSPTEHRMVDNSPMTMPPSQQAQTSATRHPGMLNRAHQSAPPELGPPHRALTQATPNSKLGRNTDKWQPVAPPIVHSVAKMNSDAIVLDRNAVERAKRSSHVSSDSISSREAGNVSLQPVEEEGGDNDAEGEDDGQDENAGQESESEARLATHITQAEREAGWGDSFKVEWLCTTRLPFHRTRHLRNPWNHDREIKVSRDGTELEPTVGQQLLDRWESLAASTSTAEVGKSAGRGIAITETQGASKSAPALSHHPDPTTSGGGGGGA